jgi:phosphoribosylglycinamide formyltransferase 1
MPTERKKSPLRIAALISGGGRTLLNILERIEAGELPAKVVRVIASNDCPGVERAAAAGLSVKVISRKDFAGPDAFSDAVTSAIQAAETDLVVAAGFLQLWKFPESFAGRVMNIHPALLPSFGGKGMYGHRVHEAVLDAGCKVSGCTVHFCDLQYDHGPIIIQRTVSVLEDDTPDVLAARVFEQECIAYPQAIGLFAAGRLRIEGGVVRIR